MQSFNSYLHTIPVTNVIEKNFYLSQNSQFTDIDISENII